jgi:alpha-L-rhamnosidase
MRQNERVVEMQQTACHRPPRILLPLLGSVLVALAASETRATNKTAATMAIRKMLCDYSVEPINVERPHPRFGWILDSSIRGQRQTAYRILVACDQQNLSKNRGEQWDSGKIVSAETVGHPYRGLKLRSNTRYFWKVIIWDQDGERLASQCASFWTSLLDPNEWKASWIGAEPDTEQLPEVGFIENAKELESLAAKVQHDGRSTLLRREFRCRGSIERARVYVTGLGFYELYLNGRKVGNHLLAPAKTPYHKQVLYDTYDVTDLVAKGKNAVGIHLGNGWYNPYKKWWRPYRMQWFGAKRAIMQLVIEYANGETEVVCTDTSWKHKAGPVLFHCVYDGEVYDAREEQPGWAEPRFDDTTWQRANRMAPPGGRLISHRLQPIQITEEKNPEEIPQPGAESRLYDMGQNFTGWARFSVQGPKGTKIILRFAEDIHEDGTLDVTSNEHAKATATFILKGDGIETCEPRFSFYGFRYVEIRGEPALPSIEAVRGCVVHTACEMTGQFECGNELLNKIHQATLWSHRSNMVGYPLDCPQRDERLGWLGDAQVTAEGAMLNMDVPLFFHNWLSGIQANQDATTGDIPIISPRPYIKDEGVEWSSTYIIILWQYYLHYADLDILANHYPAMQRYLQFLGSMSDDTILPQGWIGDWGSLVKGWKEGEPASIPTAFYYWDAKLMARIAELLGKTGDAREFASLAARIKQSYHKKYYHQATGNYQDGSQMANAFPLFLGIVPEPCQPKVLGNLVADIMEKQNGHLTTGVLGTKYMIEVLAREGRADVAYRLATQTGYPSWASMIEKQTTMCEFWNQKQSHNHVMMGSIDTFFYKTLAGIHVDENHPGFKNTIIRPFVPDALPFVRASIETVRGQLVCGWEKIATKFKLHLKIPANTTADVYLPMAEPSSIFESGILASQSKGVSFIRSAEGESHYAVESGEYTFVIEK